MKIKKVKGAAVFPALVLAVFCLVKNFALTGGIVAGLKRKINNFGGCVSASAEKRFLINKTGAAFKQKHGPRKKRPVIAELLLSLGMIISTSLAGAQENTLKPDKPNVLFIAVDDLRPELGCYGQTHIHSPNIDRLARSGIVFDNAYCNYPVCGPSRTSLLTGIYTSINRFSPAWNCSQDEDLPGVVNLPMYFKNNNYTTISLGKVSSFLGDAKGSWDKEWRPHRTTVTDYQSSEAIRISDETGRGPAYEKPGVSDIAYGDGIIAKRAIEELQNFNNTGEPFFLAVGFFKPHLPFNAPLRYWNKYDENDIQLPSNFNSFPKDAPDQARFNWGELRGYHGIPKEGLLPDSIARKLIHGYYACVSYIDAQVGFILGTLENLGLADNTIVILWGDHGWFLGEHGLWAKQCSFRRAAHSPLIVRAPWKKPGLSTEALVEFVDIYPSLCELAGLSLPFHLQGKSFVPLMDDPGQPWKDKIFYRIGEAETIVTTTHAYTEWLSRHTGRPVARMLYDHRVDPEENINISERPENEKLIKGLREKLHDHITARDRIVIQKLSGRVEAPGMEGERLPAENWGEWAFRKDEENRGVEEEWYADYEDGPEWTPVEVPAFLSQTAAGHYYGYGWYRTTFEIPEEFRGEPVIIHFEAVDEQAWVYLNGEYAGEHSEESEGMSPGQLWDRPFTIEISPGQLCDSGKNVLFVRTHAHVGQAGIWGGVNVYFPERSFSDIGA